METYHYMLLLLPWGRPVFGNLPFAGRCLQDVSRGLIDNWELLSLSFSFNHTHARGFWIKSFTRKVASTGTWERVLSCVHPACDNIKKQSNCNAGQAWEITYLQEFSLSTIGGDREVSEISQGSKSDISPGTKCSVTAGQNKIFYFQAVSWSSQISGEHLPTFETASQQSQMLQEHLLYVKKLFSIWALIYITACLQTFSLHCIGLLWLFV